LIHEKYKVLADGNVGDSFLYPQGNRVNLPVFYARPPPHTVLSRNRYALAGSEPNDLSRQLINNPRKVSATIQNSFNPNFRFRSAVFF